jgi:NitT/TauT family transport system ATP-binding protein
MPAIEFQGVHTKFGKEQVLSGIDFDVREGEFLCILGPSGCGKSTVLRIAGNLLPVQSGTVTVEGESPTEAWKRLAYVFQSPRLVPWRTAIGNVRLGLTLRYGKSLSNEEATRRANDAMELVGLSADKLKYPGVMSGGERQRVAIARALAVDPDVILMDEPLSALDAQTKIRLRDEIMRIWEETRKTVMFVTHDVDEALYLADRVLVFSNKPTTVVGNYHIERPRPRRLASDPELIQMRQEILGLLGVTDRSTSAE